MLLSAYGGKVAANALSVANPQFTKEIIRRQNEAVDEYMSKKIIGDINGYNPSKQSEISIKSHWGKYINYSKDKNVVKCGKKMHIFTSIPIKDDLFPTLVVLKSCNGNYLSLQDNG
eukprot:833009_1